MQTIGKKGIAVLGIMLLCVVMVSPATASAQTGYYYMPYTPVQNQLQYQTQQPAQVQFQSEYQYILYLMQLVAQLQQQLYYLQGGDHSGGSNDDSEVEVTTKSATNIEEDEARLRGEIDFNASDYAYVWFEWGEDEDDLDEETSRIRLDDDDDEDFSARIRNLDEDEKYYFRAVAEDEDDEKDYGAIKSFRTDDDGKGSNDDEPEADTEEADDITDDSVELNGTVDMNDFRNGIVFFVYGEDEDQIDDVERDYDSYSDVDEDGDDLQKVKVDSDLDGKSSYRLDINGLDDDTDYYFAICVEYEDEDDDETLVCGSTEHFETDD